MFPWPRCRHSRRCGRRARRTTARGSASGITSNQSGTPLSSERPMLRIRVGNAPCSWGALEFEAGGQTPDFSQVLDEMAAAGYAGTELGDWGFMPTDPATLRRELDRRRLALIAAFVPVALTDASEHDRGVGRGLQVAGLLAAAGDGAVLVLSDDTARDPARAERAGRVRAEDSLDARGWETLVCGAERIARAVREATGLRA